jgi:hypothetical protein
MDQLFMSKELNRFPKKKVGQKYETLLNRNMNKSYQRREETPQQGYSCLAREEVEDKSKSRSP